MSVGLIIGLGIATLILITGVVLFLLWWFGVIFSSTPASTNPPSSTPSGTTAAIVASTPSGTTAPTSLTPSSITPGSYNILIVSSDNGLIYTTTSKGLGKGWVSIPSSCCATTVKQLKDTTILGVGIDNMLYTSPSITSSPWKWTGPIPGSCCVRDITQLQDGTFVGVGADNSLYTTPTIQGTFTWSAALANSGCAKCFIQLLDGSFACIGCGDNQIYIKPTLTSPWTITTGGSADGKMNSYYFIYLTQFPDGTFAGVGPDNLLYTTPTINPVSWTVVGGTTGVKSVSWYR